MKQPRKSNNVDLRLYCTSGHDAQLMFLISIIDANNCDEISLACATCNHTCTLMLNPRRELTTILGEPLTPAQITTAFDFRNEPKE